MWLLAASVFAAYLVAANYLDKTYVNPMPKGEEVVELERPFGGYYDHAYVARPRNLQAEPDDPAVEGDRTSRAVVYEDDHPLGPAHASFQDIDKLGGGRFAHLPTGILFSTSDGTNPNTNGRNYWIVVPPAPPKPIGEEVVQLRGPFERFGLAYVTRPRKLRAEADDPAVESDRTSRVVIYEEGRPLGPAHAAFSDISKLGGGRFSHLPSGIVFSTSDGTDPDTNGRTYWAVVPVAPTKPPGQEVVQLIGPFERYKQANVAYHFRPRRLAAQADSPTIPDDHTSKVVVYEDNTPLGPGHASFRDIDEHGGGRFAHLPNGITFSSSDGSDPNTNGRVYWAVVP